MPIRWKPRKSRKSYTGELVTDKDMVEWYSADLSFIVRRVRIGTSNRTGWVGMRKHNGVTTHRLAPAPTPDMAKAALEALHAVLPPVQTHYYRWTTVNGKRYRVVDWEGAL